MQLPNRREKLETIPEESDSEEMQERMKLEPQHWPVRCTTLMLRNIPNTYSPDMIVDLLHSDMKGKMDFMYLPMNFRTKLNLGYVFVNFRREKDCAHLAKVYSGIQLPAPGGNKSCEVWPARIQGCAENVRSLQNSPSLPTLLQTPEWLPRLFDEEGRPVKFPTEGVQSQQAHGVDAHFRRNGRRTWKTQARIESAVGLSTTVR